MADRYFGMPGSAIDTGAVDHILALDRTIRRPSSRPERKRARWPDGRMREPSGSSR